MTERAVTHATFVLERVYPAPPARVFAAWTTREAKARWFVGAAEGIAVIEPMSLDFRVGGTERLVAGAEGGPVYTYEGCFQDIVPDERIVETTQMYSDKNRISVSVVSVEFLPEGDGTRLVLTEQGSYLDGLDKPEWREVGTRQQLEALAKEFTA